MKDYNFRPANLDSFVGQKSAVNSLKMLVKSAVMRFEPMDHVLITGPAGLGKTSLANIVADCLGSNLHTVNATTIKSKNELIEVLVSLQDHDILFLDEIHALNPRVAEVLYTAMEDGCLCVVSRGETSQVKIAPFTLVGATTVPGMVPRPLLDRFGETLEMQPYETYEMQQIIENNLMTMGYVVEDAAVRDLATMSRGVPRIANRLVRLVRDYAVVNGLDLIVTEDVQAVGEMLGIDRCGLDKSSRNYLEVLFKAPGALGVASICNLINESQETIVNNIEPNLMRMGLVTKSVKGRILTKNGAEYMKVIPPNVCHFSIL